MNMTLNIHVRRKRTLQGALLGLGAPLGWIVVERLAGLNHLVPDSYTVALFSYMILGTMLVFSIFGFILGRAEEGFARMSLLDDLTGLCNLRMFHTVLEREFANASRYATPLSLAIVDLDHFKKVNDTYGHKIGDDVLKAVAATILEQVREGDIVARIGGEELAVIMPQTGCPGGRIMGERVRQAVSATEVPLDGGGTVRVNCSLGLACTDVVDVETTQELFVLADKALYHAKETGRNRIVLISDVPGLLANLKVKKACCNLD